jgi:hypothetical protein
MNTVVAYPKNGPMTQGTIFTCAVAQDYAGCSVHGLILTARCDIAQDKVRVYNYLPMVELDDWLHRDGRVILAQRLESDATGTMRNVLQKSGFSPAILELEHPRRILETLFPDGSDKDLRQRFERACLRFEMAGRCINSAPTDRLCLVLGNEVPKLRDTLLSELVHNALNGFYFLRSIDPSGSDLGHVVLIREIQILPRELAHAIASGLEHNLYESMCQSHPSMQEKLAMAADDIAYPVGQVVSPHLEHILQTFAFLFSRIGLPDPDKSYIAGLWNSQPTVKASSSNI